MRGGAIQSVTFPVIIPVTLIATESELIGSSNPEKEVAAEILPILVALFEGRAIFAL